ncbi:MAG: hypothetical protein ACI9FN_001911, partial [Saprospiraceae bacterium]
FAALVSCDQQGMNGETHPMDRLSDDKAGEIVRKAIEYAGGWDTWGKKENFSFYKKITQVDSAGAVIKTTRQLHQYSMGIGFQGRMTWTVNEDEFIIVNTGEESRKYKNGSELTDDKSKNEAWNSSFGSHYVISMPFKLTDPGTILTYDGIDAETLHKPVHAVKVNYEKGAGSTGGMHTWWYYFDIENYDLLGNYLDYGKGQSLTTYETFTEVEDIRLHLKRYSYASNKKKEKVMLKTIYENEEMMFDNQIDKSTFQLL